jgi:uncharacterized protein (TIGR00255 family)
LAEEGPSASSIERLVLGAVKAAVADLIEAREAEGERLEKAMQRELKQIAKHRDAIARRVPGLVRSHQQQLTQRLRVLLGGERLASDDPTLKREVAVLADRGDVTEELDRLASHLVAFGKAMAGTGTVGRRLDFLLQEIVREVNTIGGKSSDLKVTGHVIEMKSAAEKLREQAANIE